MRVIIFTIIAFAVAAVAPANAAWQYTKWGMTPKQVIAASKNYARPGDPQDMAEHSAKDGSATIKLQAPYTAGTFLFTAYFSFDQQDHLAGVSLKLESGNPHEVIGALNNRYGNPENHTPLGVASAWRWNAPQDRVSAIMIGENLSVNYGPRHSANEKGL